MAGGRSDFRSGSRTVELAVTVVLSPDDARRLAIALIEQSAE